MTELARSDSSYGVVEAEPPELLGNTMGLAGHLLASATAFLFMAFVFAYFYLRSLNNGGLWHPKHVDPSQGFGAVVMALVVATAVLVRLGLLDQRAGRRAQWRVKGAVALVAGLAAVVVQIVEWTAIGFGPADGGYASVFFGWTAFFVLFLLGALLWLENLLATAIRYRSEAPALGHASGDPGRLAHDVRDPLALMTPGLGALSFYWSFLAGLGVLSWIVLYLI
jgi:heme/copper-type cytochrome/quinol oxidase subunit 3